MKRTSASQLDTSKNLLVTGGWVGSAPLRRGRSLDCRRWVLSRACFWPFSRLCRGETAGALHPRSGQTDRAYDQSHGPFSCANTCPTAARTFDLAPFARAVCLGIGLRGGFLRWICERRPFSARSLSFARER